MSITAMLGDADKRVAVGGKEDGAQRSRFLGKSLKKDVFGYVMPSPVSGTRPTAHRLVTDEDERLCRNLLLNQAVSR